MNAPAYIVRASRIPAVWDEVAPVLAPAVAKGHGEFDLGQLRHMLLLGKATLIVFGEAVEAALVVEFVDYPAMRVGNIIVAAGEGLTDNNDGWNEVKRWLKGEGCKSVQAYCDWGAARLFKRLGMETVYSVVRGDL